MTEIEQWQIDDALGSYACAIAEIARRVKSGEEPMPTIGYFESAETQIQKHLKRQHEWSLKTFGPGDRVKGVVAHIRKELLEIEAEPGSLEEWIDVVILAFDGAWRAGYTPAQIEAAWLGKQAKNEAREWPDWRTMPFDSPIEHKR